MSRARKVRQHRAQELRRDLEMMIGLELGVTARADMVQHENGADAREDRPQQMMRAGEVKRSQSGADDVVAKLLHSGVAGRLGCDCETSGKPLKKQLVGRAVRRRTIPCYFGFDSLARVCFLSVSSAPFASEARARGCRDSSRTSENGAPGPAGHRMHGLFRWSSKWWPGTIPLVVFWAIAAWTSTAPLESDLAARSTSALKDTVLDKSRIEVAGRDVTFAADAFSEDGRRSAVASVEAVPGVRLVNDETRLVPEAKPFVWSAERDVVRVTLGGSSPLPASKAQVAGGGPRRSRRRRSRRPDEFVARRAAAFRQCRAAAARSDREIEGRQDHDFRYQGQPFRHGARPRRPGSDRGGAEKSPRGLFGRRQRDQGAALYLPGLQGSGRGDADADRLCARQQCPCRACDRGGAQVLQRKGGRQSQGQRRRSLRLRQRGGAGAGRAVAAVDRHACGDRPRGEAVGRRAV